jgi:hypothetical protein
MQGFKAQQINMSIMRSLLILMFTLISILEISKAYGLDKNIELICENYIVSNLSNYTQIKNYASKLNSTHILYIDTISHFGNSKFCYVRTHLIGTNYNINFCVNVFSGKCFIINFGQSGYEKYSPRSLSKLIKNEKNGFQV